VSASRRAGANKLVEYEGEMIPALEKARRISGGKAQRAKVPVTALCVGRHLLLRIGVARIRLSPVIHHGGAVHDHGQCCCLLYAAKTIVEYKGELMTPIEKAKRVQGVMLTFQCSDCCCCCRCS
jgi:hypothetical protein